MAQQSPSPLANYGRSGGILLLNPTDRNIGRYVAPAPFTSGLTARSARDTRVIRAAVVPVYDPTGASASTATLASIAPSTGVHGGSSVVVTCTGTGFTSATLVMWDGVTQATTFTSATTISFSAQMAGEPAARTALVAVVKPGERPTATKPFTIT